MPGLPYSVATLLWIRPALEPQAAYRIVTAILGCLGPVTLFLFAAYFTRSTRWAFAAAIGYSLCSPAYDLFETIDKDRGLLSIPWRLQVMVKYGEGPHNAGLTLLPIALITVFAAARSRGFPRLFLAAIALAAVALTHWIAAFALAIACLLAMLVYAGTDFRIGRLIAAGVLGYGLACFWLTPTFVQTVGFNWPKDAFNYQLQNKQKFALLLILGLVLLVRFLFRNREQYRYLCFVTLCFLVFAAFAEGHYAHGIDTIPESRRYTLEMELFLALAITEWMRVGWQAGGGVNRFCVLLVASLLALQGTPQARRFVSSGYDSWTLRPKEQTVEYHLASWLAARQPQGRIYVSGGLRFRLNSWFNLTQTNGTFDSGLANRHPLDWDYRLRSLKGLRPGLETEDSLSMLQAMGVEYLVVHGPKSEEYYRDIQQPERFAALEKVHSTGDDAIYKVPFRSFAHHLRPDEIPDSWDPFFLGKFVHATQDPQRVHLLTSWPDLTQLRITGGVLPEGARISLLMNYDPGWHALQDGKPIPIQSDALGFTLLKPATTDETHITLHYSPTFEKKAAALVSALLWLLSLAHLTRRIPWPSLQK